LIPATNGPGLPSTYSQYNSWFIMIGLGNESAFYTSGAQFAILRKTANPVLSMRYDNGIWRGWTGVTAEALTSGNKTIAGILTTTVNIDCSGGTGIAINSSAAFFTPDSVDAGNLTNTYLNLKFAGSTNDWCYISQIGGDNAYELACRVLYKKSYVYCLSWYSNRGFYYW
jgi:hypothetical protein